ncbi:MAG: amylo-alpha-1,6-glucosidase [Candidatus Bathyarchaeota archaeon]|nr:amylo-alpha-1,6-glucosidase [Candidatus Bathyarchaeota archaeon]
MRLPAISLNREMLSRFDDAVSKEWIITNGLGGYASSTVLGLNMRKYHGLLVAAFNPPGDRRICLAKLDEEVSIGNSTYPLYVNEFPNGIFPQGHTFLKEFSIMPFPKYFYSVQNVEIQKTIFMPYAKNATIAIYKILNKNTSDIKIRIFPLINWRHIHSVTDRWKISWEFATKHENKEVNMHFDIPKSVLVMKATNGHYHNAGRWIEKLHYREEAARGESCLDDCYQPGYFEVDAKANKSEDFAIIAVADKSEDVAQKILAEMPLTTYDAEMLSEQEMARHEAYLTRFYENYEGISRGDWLDWIILATDAFLVKGTDDKQRSIIAGYPWFGAWGRDTFVSLPGLLLVTGRFEDAKKVFLTFKNYCKQGLIPNCLPEQTEPPAYNTVDATLWFVNAILQYLKYTEDFRFVQDQLWETLKNIVESHFKGTAFEIHVANDGLLSHGPQLTWMDVAINGQPLTPRVGKAVEVQALWYNALKTMELLASKFKEGSEAEKYLQMAEKAKKSFAEKFWDSEKSCLFDVVNENTRDDSLRPNQIIAVSLDFTMLDKMKNEKIVDAIHRELLTPYGLRTLARSDPRYVGVYAGDRNSRDRAYHNGTVWPWLLGTFVTAFLKTKGYVEYRHEYALKNFILPLFTEQVLKAGLGTINEIFDGEPPHTPRGCIAQAWSVAEPLRAYVEDVMQVRPKYEKQVLQKSS